MPEWFSPLKEAAYWIWIPRDHAAGSATPGRVETALFHGSLTPPPGTHSIELHVSAEGRYTIWVNDGEDPLGHGPARTDRFHRSLDSYELDVSEAGEKPVHLWAEVKWFAGWPEAPLAELMGPEPGFVAMVLFLDQAGRIIGKAGTDHSWRTCLCTGAGLAPPGIHSYYVVGYVDEQRSSGWPEDWRKAASPSDARWSPPAEMPRPYFKRDPDLPGGPRAQSWLIRREIPHMEYDAMPIRENRRGTPGGSEPVENVAPFELTANQSATFRCDMGELVLAYCRLRLKGEGTRLSITTSEVLARGEGDTREKSFRLDSNFLLSPVTDVYTLDTPRTHTFESSHWRTFRFLELTLTAGPQGGGLESFTLHATGYPFTPDYAFDASTESQAAQVQDDVRKMVDISWRTLKRCTWETYMDCPYYEQLQYSGDTRIQCLITYVTTGDPILPAQALRAFDRSRIPEGITQSRYPCDGPIMIPTFSLIHILMIEDYLNHVGDDGLVAELRPGIAPILNWFTQFTDQETGLIGYTAYWPFVDWVKGWKAGTPPHGGKGPGFADPKYSGSSACINLFYLLALQAAATIYEHTKPGSGNFYHARATALKQRIYDTFFDAGRGLMCDVPVEVGKGKLGVWSQHAQALAVLAEILSPSEARAAMATAIDPRNVLHPEEPVNDFESLKAGKFESRFIAPASFYFLFYVAEALAKLRMGEQVWALLAPFRQAIERGCTTWPEKFEPARSECHAWGAWPLYFFGRHVLGIAPPSLEDGRVRVRPLFCPPLTEARGHFQTHRGPVTVEVSWKDGIRQVEAKGNGVEAVGE